MGEGSPFGGGPGAPGCFSLFSGPLAKSSDYKLHIQESVTVQESLCVTVPCTFSYSSLSFGSLYLSWFRKGVDTKDGLPVATNKPAQRLQGRTQGRFLLPMGLKHNDCSLIIRDVNRRDSGTYFLRIEKGFSTHSYSDKMLSLKVTGTVGGWGKAPGCGVPEIEK